MCPYVTCMGIVLCSRTITSLSLLIDVLSHRKQLHSPRRHNVLILIPRSSECEQGRSYFASGADPGFGQGGAPASEAKSCRCSEVESCKQSEQSAAGVQGLLKGPGRFWDFNAQICNLTHSRDSFSLIFDIYFDTKS